MENLKSKNKKIPWTTEQEVLLAEWAEKAKCFRWLHYRAEKKYRTRNYAFTIPVIILSTLTGTANFAMDSFVPESHKQIAMACVGSVNIFAGILSTLQNFLRYAELMETNRACEVLWSKFGRNIEVELALEPNRRKPADEFLITCRAEYDALIEQSPSIDDDIIKQFKNSFKKTDICKPDICNGLDKCTIYEAPKEEKIANLLVKASDKLSSNISKKPNYSFNNINSVKEISELSNIGRVSSFKKNKTNTVSNVLDEIKLLNVKDEINLESENFKKEQTQSITEDNLDNKLSISDKSNIDNIDKDKGNIDEDKGNIDEDNIDIVDNIDNDDNIDIESGSINFGKHGDYDNLKYINKNT